MFKESLNTAVFTTSFVIENNSVITYVCHDSDGSWQFQGNEVIEDDDNIRLVSLGEILELDKSIIALSDLPIGFEATRSGKEKEWIILSIQ